MGTEGWRLTDAIPLGGGWRLSGVSVMRHSCRDGWWGWLWNGGCDGCRAPFTGQVAQRCAWFQEWRRRQLG